MARDLENYKYFESKILGLEYCMHKQTGEVIFSDGIRYSQEEIKLLKDLTNNPEIDNERKTNTIKAIHLLKKTFNGKITNNEIEAELNKL